MSSLFEEFMKYLASTEDARRIVDRLFAETDRSVIMQNIMVNCFDIVFHKWLLLRDTHEPIVYAQEIENCVRGGGHGRS